MFEYQLLTQGYLEFEPGMLQPENCSKAFGKVVKEKNKNKYRILIHKFHWNSEKTPVSYNIEAFFRNKNNINISVTTEVENNNQTLEQVEELFESFFNNYCILYDSFS